MPRLLHTMLRVGNLDTSIRFYTEVLGMKLLRKKDYPHGKFTLAFIGYDTEDKATVLELTHNWETSEYDLGSAYGHIAIEVDDVYEACKAIAEKCGEEVICRKPGPMPANDPNGVILAFVVDPDGYKVEILGKKDYADKFEINTDEEAKE